FCRGPPSPSTRQTHPDSGRFQVSSCGFSTYTGRLLDTPQRPAQLPQCDDLLFFFFAQDIAHVGGAYPPCSMSRTLSLSLAGFQLITIGRFWVITEAVAAGRSLFRIEDLLELAQVLRDLE